MRARFAGNNCALFTPVVSGNAIHAVLGCNLVWLYGALLTPRLLQHFVCAKARLELLPGSFMTMPALHCLYQANWRSCWR
jgi:hypothetical protein